MEKTVAELFAGVGGFRVGLNEVTLKQNGKAKEKSNFKFVYANQWEPSSKIQHAFDCYETRFGHALYHSNENISDVNKKEIPDHTLLVGGFPCQDYSVARSLSKEKGIQGIKGVLWWQIRDTIEAKQPPFILLENVDRLLKSPSKQRGRDFGIMLRTLADLGYGVEWRVINASEYGHVQRRRRVFIFAFHNSTNYYKTLVSQPLTKIITNKGIFSKAFKVEENSEKNKLSEISIESYIDLVILSDNYQFLFENSGVMIDYKISTAKTFPKASKINPLSSIILSKSVDEIYFINDDKNKKFDYLKDSKSIPRTNSEGFVYNYSEGKMTYPDKLDKPGRTMLTSEGTVNRSTHVIEDIQTGEKRVLTPIEAERLNEFPDDWTNTGMTERKRYFMMGNALVTGVVKKIGKEISDIIDLED